MPSTSATTAAAVNAGLSRSIRSACFRSCESVPNDAPHARSRETRRRRAGSTARATGARAAPQRLDLDRLWAHLGAPMATDVTTATFTKEVLEASKTLP